MHVTKPYIASPTLRLNVAIALTFVALTVLVTYPQVEALPPRSHIIPIRTSACGGLDGWRMPSERTRAASSTRTSSIQRTTRSHIRMRCFSPALVLAPLFWAGVHPVIIYNSPCSRRWRCRDIPLSCSPAVLTGSVAVLQWSPASIYAFAPYRFTHYVHLELQMVSGFRSHYGCCTASWQTAGCGMASSSD